MAVGRSRHYRIDQVAPRHWVETVDAGKLPRGTAEAILAELAARIDPAIQPVADQLPPDFPQAMFGVTRQALRRRAHDLGAFVR